MIGFLNHIILYHLIILIATSEICIALLNRDNEIVAKYFRAMNLMFTAISEKAVNRRLISRKYFATISLSLSNSAIQISEVKINMRPIAFNQIYHLSNEHLIIFSKTFELLLLCNFNLFALLSIYFAGQVLLPPTV